MYARVRVKVKVSVRVIVGVRVMVNTRVRIKVRVSVRFKEFWRVWQEYNGKSLPCSTKLVPIFSIIQTITYYFSVNYNVVYYLIFNK